ncbi:MAG: acyl-CoA/acyl-ACP dehydrogenase [Gammaproteobacteria bacterium]|nr:acyl-CoA/acyl-ACP dehydrogenase [Gammaproteobacteria bacterium]
MNGARQAIEWTSGLIDRGRAHFAHRDVDEVQMEVYDLALSTAEIHAARAMLDFADLPAPSDEASFKRSLANLFCADTLATVVGRLQSRPTAFGLHPRHFDGRPPSFIDEHLKPTNIAAIGQTVRHRQGRPPDDHLGEEKSLMRDTFRQFAEEQVVPLAEDIHRNDRVIPDAIIDGLRGLGCFGLSVPARYGGLKPDDREDSLGMVVVTEELSRGSLGAAGSLITRPEIMARAVLEGGTDAQKARWLPGIAAGDPLVAISVTEPGTGSDVASVALRATPAGDGKSGWILNGGKTWCTFAGKAGALLVLARTDPNAMPPHRGLSLFVVSKPGSDGQTFTVDSPMGGRLTGRAIPTIGYRGMHSFELFFDDFAVPGDALVGEAGGRGRGFYYTMSGFSGGRLQTAARACGLMRAAFDRALEYAEQRRVFDRSVAEYPLTLQKLARMAATIAACQQFSYAVARTMDGGNGQLEASLVKLIACRAAEWITREAMQIHGGLGYAEESDVSRYFVDARVLSIFEGTEETLALKVVGKALLP